MKKRKVHYQMVQIGPPVYNIADERGRPWSTPPWYDLQELADFCGISPATLVNRYGDSLGHKTVRVLYAQNPDEAMLYMDIDTLKDFVNITNDPQNFANQTYVPYEFGLDVIDTHFNWGKRIEAITYKRLIKHAAIDLTNGLEYTFTILSKDRADFFKIYNAVSEWLEYKPFKVLLSDDGRYLTVEFSPID